jgi:hypothetical protein
MREPRTIELFGMELTNTSGVVTAVGDSFHLPSGTEIELATLWQFVYADTGDKASAIAVAHPELLGPDVDTLLEELSGFMPLGVADLSGLEWQAETVRLWDQARKALQLCRRFQRAAALGQFLWEGPDRSKVRPT